LSNNECRKLKAYRAFHGVKQETLAKLLGIGMNTYSFKENGKNSFSLDETKAIADFFKTTVEDIFF
jgi:putative transcriptional regulator